MLNRRRILKMGATACVPLGSGNAGQLPPVSEEKEAGILSKDTLNHFYRFFSDICHRYPTTQQDQTLLAAEAIWQLLHAWRPKPPEKTEWEKVSSGTLKQRDTLFGLFTTVDGAGNLKHPLMLTADIPRGIILLDDPLRPRLGEVRAAFGATRVKVNGIPGLGLDLPVHVERPARILGKIVDKDTGKRWPGRVSVLDSNREYRHAKAYAAIATVSEKPVIFRPAWQKLPFFYSDGSFEVLLPSGTTMVSLERGCEHEIVRKMVDLSPGETVEITISSGRLVDLRSRGWISGDTHVHWCVNSWDENESPELLKVVQRAEDVRVVNNLTLYQWRQNKPFTKPDNAPPGPVQSVSDPDYIVHMGEEFRNDNHYGHINLLGIKSLIHPISTGPGSGGDAKAFDWPLNREIIAEAKKQGAVVCEAHNLGPFHSSSVPIHVAMRLSDCLDQLEPQHYYRFLDCGFRIGLGNGSDHPARLVGCCRVYVQTGELPGEPISHRKWIDGLKAGRSFTTSGPILLLTCEGHGPGEIVSAKLGDTVKVRLHAISKNPLGKVEIIGSGGRILGTIETSKHEATIDIQEKLAGSSWFVGRASRNQSFDALSGPDIAHTSAVYVEVPNKPVFDSESAKWWIGNIRQHRERLRLQGNFPDEGKKNEALAFIDQGIGIYEELIRKGLAK